MSKLFWVPYIEFVNNQNCSDVIEELLMNRFTDTMKKVAVSSARKAWFALEDFDWVRLSDQREELEPFEVMVERRIINGQTQWWGTYTHGDKNLLVVGTLEPN